MDQKFCGCYEIVPSNGWYGGRLQKRWLPRVRMETHTTISINASRTTLKQVYHNPSDTDSIEKLKYDFPLYDGVSVVACDFEIGNHKIHGVVKERQAARSTFDAAVSRGESAGLLEQLPAASDVFTISVGNVPPAASVVAHITYIGELKHDAEVDGVRFVLATAIAPRYGTGVEIIQVAAEGKISVTVDISMPSGVNISKLVSPSHPVSVSLGTVSTSTHEEPSLSRGSASLALNSAELGKDFVLQIVLGKNNGTPMALLEQHPSIEGQRALMLTFVPRFNLKMIHPEIVFVVDRSGSMADKIPTLISALQVFLKSLPVGIKFNICSFGSRFTFLWSKSKTYDPKSVKEALAHVSTFSNDYGGTETENAIRATFGNRLGDMPLECLLLTDGEIWNQESLFRYVDDEVRKSDGAIRLFSLGIGDAVSSAMIEGVARAGGGFAQTVLEGEQLSGKVVRMLKGALFPHIKDYTLELDSASEKTSKSALPTRHKSQIPLADKNDDAEDFDMVWNTETEDIDSYSHAGNHVIPAGSLKTISLFDQDTEMDLSPPKHNPEDKYGHLPTVASTNHLQAPHKIPQLFPVNRVNIYLLLSPGSSTEIPKKVLLRGTAVDGPLELEVPVEILEAPGKTIHQLAARKAIHELEDGRGWIIDAKDTQGELLREKYPSRMDELAEREGVALGVQYQVVGKWTSFVAVDREAGTESPTPDVELDYMSIPSTASPFASVGALHQNANAIRCSTFGAHYAPPPAMPAPPIIGWGGRGTAFGSAVVPQSTGFPTNMIGNFSLASLPRLAAPPPAVPASPVGGRGGALFGMGGRGGGRGGIFGKTLGASRDGALFGAKQASNSDDGAFIVGAMESAKHESDSEIGAYYDDREMRRAKEENDADDGDVGFSLFDDVGTSKRSQNRMEKETSLRPAVQLLCGALSRPALEQPTEQELELKSGRSSRVFTANFNRRRRSTARFIGTQPAPQVSPRQTIHNSSLLQKLINTQRFDGSWDLDAIPLIAMGCDNATITELRQHLSKTNCWDPQSAVATILVVAFFEKKLAVDKDTWELVVDKARVWLTAKLGGAEEELLLYCKDILN